MDRLLNRGQTEGKSDDTIRMPQLTEDDLSEVLIRWKLALEYLSETRVDVTTEGHAVRVLVSRDVPRLVRELGRLNPDLQGLPYVH